MYLDNLIQNEFIVLLPIQSDFSGCMEKWINFHFCIQLEKAEYLMEVFQNEIHYKNRHYLHLHLRPL